LFEFGKRYRNTIKINPFSSLVMIGGFGNLTGEIDFWALDSLVQVGKAKSSCSIGIEWGPDGKTLMTAVFWDRIKVDNFLNLFSASGKKLLTAGNKFDELHGVCWQPLPKGALSKPDLTLLEQEAEQV